MRRAVIAFAHAMEYKLGRNDHKGGWQDTPNIELYGMLEREVEELQEALNRGNYLEILLEAADVANFALMLAWNNTNEAFQDQSANSRHSEGTGRQPMDYSSDAQGPDSCRTQLQRGDDRDSDSREGEWTAGRERSGDLNSPSGSGPGFVGTRSAGSDNGGPPNTDQKEAKTPWYGLPEPHD